MFLNYLPKQPLAPDSTHARCSATDIYSRSRVPSRIMFHSVWHLPLFGWCYELCMLNVLQLVTGNTQGGSNSPQGPQTMNQRICLPACGMIEQVGDWCWHRTIPIGFWGPVWFISIQSSLILSWWLRGILSLSYANFAIVISITKKWSRTRKKIETSIARFSFLCKRGTIHGCLKLGSPAIHV